LRHIAGLQIELQLAGIDLGEVQDVIDDAEQVGAGLLDFSRYSRCKVFGSFLSAR